MLARSDLGHYAAKTGMKINLRRNLIGQHIAVRIDNRHRRLVTGALDSEYEATTLNLDTLLGRALGRRQGPYALLGCRRLRRGVIDRKHEGKWGRHDDGILAGAVVATTTTRLGKAQGGIECNRVLIAVLDLERGRRATEHLGVIAHVRQQLAGNALTTMRRIDGNVHDLHVTIDNHTAGKAQELAVIVSNPPAARSGNVLTQLGQEHARGPRLVPSAFKAGCLQRARALGISCAHGAELQMATGELIGHARNFTLCALGKPKTPALVFLGIRKTRIDRQDAGRISVARSMRKKQALARRPPQVALHAAGGLLLMQKLAVTYQAVARQPHLIPVGGLAPLIERHGCLDHALTLKLTLGAFVPQHIQRRVHLAAHGVSKNTKLAAHAGLPCRPGASIERRHAQQRHVGTARQTLRSGDADTHARKRAGTATDHITADIAAIQAGLLQYAINSIHELHIGMAATQMVATHQLRLARLCVTPAYRAGKHISRSVERHHRRVVPMQAHLVQPYQSNRKAPSHARREPQA